VPDRASDRAEFRAGLWLIDELDPPGRLQNLRILQPDGAGLFSTVPQAGPPPLLGMIDKAGPERIALHVPAD